VRRSRGLCVAALVLASAAHAAPPAPLTPPANLLLHPQKPEIVELGEGRYRVGSVEIDKNQGRFTAPGRVLRAEPPLEFLAVSKDGRKGYEAMIELDATAFEFNLACILIGLDGERTTGRPTYHFDPQPVEGDRVAIDVSWGAPGAERRVPAESLLVDGGKTVPAEWVYTGSGFTANGNYLAHIDGTLIGLVHDPSSVIEHRSGLGINTYGSITAAPGAPAAQTRVVLELRRLPATDDAAGRGSEDEKGAEDAPGPPPEEGD
jgi:hypothetical protein